MKINAVLQKYPELERPEAVFDITNILDQELECDISETGKLRARCIAIKNLHGVRIRPPFPITWYEGYLDPEKRNTFGFYLIENNNILSCILFQCDSRGVKRVASQGIQMDEKYMVFENSSLIRISYNKELANAEHPDILTAFHELFYPMHYANALLNCKNVSTDAHDFSNRRSISHYKRTGKPYFEKYYTLKVKLPGKKHTAGNGENGGWSNAFHIYRGHFKTYTEAAPLFGKLTGTYWWESGIRGNLDTGIIDKDYELEVGE